MVLAMTLTEGKIKSTVKYLKSKKRPIKPPPCPYPNQNIILSKDEENRSDASS